MFWLNRQVSRLTCVVCGETAEMFDAEVKHQMCNACVKLCTRTGVNKQILEKPWFPVPLFDEGRFAEQEQAVESLRGRHR